MNQSDLARRLLFEIHSGHRQEAPGDRASTCRAYKLLQNRLPVEPRVLDLGCGPGRQTMDLLYAGAAEVVALDLHRPYLEALRERSVERGVACRVKVVEADMAHPPLAPESFDLLWSEGAVYSIGFERGLRRWRPLLKTGGWLVVTELVWFQTPPPAPVYRFWRAAYPAMRDRLANARSFAACGYQLESQFTLPAAAWWAYYEPIVQRLTALRSMYVDNPSALAVLAQESREIELYRQYGEYYGYECYLARKPPG